jgi:hypothetical protein
MGDTLFNADYCADFLVKVTISFVAHYISPADYIKVSTMN